MAPNMSDPVPLYKRSFEFGYDWGTVTAAWLGKFPDPKLKQVKSVETASCIVAHQSSCHDTMTLRRVFCVSFGVPGWIQKVLGISGSGLCSEEACWDLPRRQLVMYGRNETLKTVFCIEEVCTYSEIAPGRTLYTQEATVIHRTGILSGAFLGLAAKFLQKTSQATMQKGLDAMVANVEALVIRDNEQRAAEME
eukprot:gnl/MRDRNA2_/MRDRNA2_124029_c0_seq1.p1 gnl/MRDRNA2_/MRDRNA2_124029_c0~~gnl/MRDRNA2_/MRDRNA2_124029_c0_seq1.p1  ORF type:complete len:194 (-),score=34.00 gnl/MRDRNA2_/MRDRNA2_124029_c0_seq1:120-701(-)